METGAVIGMAIAVIGIATFAGDLIWKLASWVWHKLAR